MRRPIGRRIRDATAAARVIPRAFPVTRGGTGGALRSSMNERTAIPPTLHPRRPSGARRALRGAHLAVLSSAALLACSASPSPEAHDEIEAPIDHIQQAWVAEDLGGVVLAQEPSVVGDSAHKKLFYAGPNGHLFMSTFDGGPWWSAPVDLGGAQLTSKPAAAITGPNKLKVWYRGPNGHLWMSTYDGGPWWSAPADLGGVQLTSEPSVVVRGPDKYSVFYRGPNDHLWMSTYDGGPWWSQAWDLGGVALGSAPAAVIPSGEPTHIRVFYKGTNGHLWMSSFDGGPWWSAPADLGGYTLGSAPGVVSASAHGIDAFYRGPGGQLMHSEWTGGPWWSAPFQDGVTIPGTPSALGATEVYYRGANGHLFVAHPRGWQAAPLTASGLTTSNEGAPLLVTQGLAGNTLIAGKQLLVRLFSARAAAVKAITVTVSNPDGSSPRDFQLTGSALIADTTLPAGPSVGFILPGLNVPDATTYTIAMSATDSAGNEVQRSTRALAFLPTVDMRFNVAMMRHAGFFEPQPSWTTDVQNSMARLASMLPVRDGIDASVSSSSCSGLRYQIATTCDGWSGWNACVYDQTRQWNAQLAPRGQQVDLTFEFRWGFYPPELGDPNPGGNSARPSAPYSDLRRGACVSGWYEGRFMTAPCFAQELGHNYGAEPPGSPHYQDPNDHGHSKDPVISDPYAFDFVKRVPYSQIGDTMNNAWTGSWLGNDKVLYNAYDWEYLRQQFLAAKTAGATGTGRCGP
jgi:hypothetical protein